MNENVSNNNESVEEVPLDLFNQVNLDDYKPIETLDLTPKTKEQNDRPREVISIPAGAYKAAMLSENKEENQSSN